MEHLFLANLCKLCNAKLTGQSQAVSHYKSERHKKNLEAHLLSYNGSSIGKCFCYLCCTELMDNKSKHVHIHSFPHKHLSVLKAELIKIGIKDEYWIVERLPTATTVICSICKVTSACENNFVQHINGYRHKEAFETWKISATKELIKTLGDKYNCFYCKTCDKILNGTNEATHHYTSAGHHLQYEKTNVPMLNQNQTITVKAPLQTPSNLFGPFTANSLPNKSMETPLLPGVQLIGAPQAVSPYGRGWHTQNSESVQALKISLNSGALYYCYVCCTNLKDLNSKRQHIANFPHKELNKIKSELYKNGIKDQFWIVKQFPTAFQPAIITCTICNVTSPCENNFVDHVNGFKHMNAYECWKVSPSRQRLNELEYERNYFYCQTCNKVLDGTTEAEQHYIGQSHLIMLQAKKSASSFGFRNFPSLTSSETVKEPPPSNENKASREQFLSTDILPKTPSDQPVKNAPLDLQVYGTITAQHVKQKVFNELEKLVQKLYYSRSVPYDKALEFLKKVNQDVEVLATEHKAPEEILQASSESTNQPFSNSETIHKFTASEKKQAALKDILLPASSIPSNGHVNDTSINTEVIVEKKPDTLKNKSAVTSSQIPVNGSFSQIPSNIEINHRTEATVETVPGNTNECDVSNAKDIPGLLQQIVQRREEIERNSSNGKASLEKELLQEIEILIKQIDVGAIPLDLLLQYLEDSNKRLQLLSEPTVDLNVEKQAEEKNGISLVEVNAKSAAKATCRWLKRKRAIKEATILKDIQVERQLEEVEDSLPKSNVEENVNHANAVKEKLDRNGAFVKDDKENEVKNSSAVNQKLARHEALGGESQILIDIQVERQLENNSPENRITLLEVFAENKGAVNQKPERKEPLDEEVNLNTEESNAAGQNLVRKVTLDEQSTLLEDIQGERQLKAVENHVEELNQKPEREDEDVKLVYSKEELLDLRTVETFCPVPRELRNFYKIYVQELKYPSFYNYYLDGNFKNFMTFLDVYLQSSIMHVIAEDSSAVDHKLAREEALDDDKEEVLDLRTVEPSCTEPRDSQELNYPSFYNYYSQDDFKEYMDFLDSYLQSSTSDHSMQQLKMMCLKEEPLELRTVDTFCTVPEELHNKTYVQEEKYPSLYNYYLDENFERFMNFSEVYMQSSTTDYRLQELGDEEDNSQHGKQCNKTVLTDFGPQDEPLPTVTDPESAQNTISKGQLDDVSLLSDSATIYSYYSDSNFNEFMDFLDVYLQGPVGND